MVPAVQPGEGAVAVLIDRVDVGPPFFHEHAEAIELPVGAKVEVPVMSKTTCKASTDVNGRQAFHFRRRSLRPPEVSHPLVGVVPSREQRTDTIHLAVHATNRQRRRLAVVELLHIRASGQEATD